MQIIKTDERICAGCDRCVRECPVEVANVTVKDEAGNLKVRVDADKCINCGHCLDACRHNARYYEDDTARFFADLARGIPISIIAAPSIKTNITKYKRLFTYLKALGVNKIYDVSMGADICIWAHLRYMEEYGAGPIITSPCPVIVNYCEMYNHGLLENLSPIYSPMACTSVYMTKYKGIHDRVAAISPCFAKADEFSSTNLSQYNITFEKLLEYMSESGVVLPKDETGFDHDESGLGSIFPKPGGLKENIEYFTGKKLHISKSEGGNVYDLLDKYSNTPKVFRPDIFDVLNCSEGCNLGPANAHEKDIFEINMTMYEAGKLAADVQRKKHFEALHSKYDETFELADFMRTYKPIDLNIPVLTEEDIERGFSLLGKLDFDAKHIDCGACGSDTCYRMARMIALGVNIPENCMIKAKEDVAKEHELNIAAARELAINERKREEAEAASRAKSSFLGTVSHEIRTPMNAILGIAEIWLGSDALPADVRDALAKIYSSGDLLLGIINDILDMSKIEAGKLELVEVSYELASLISDTAQLNMMRIGSKLIEFELYIDENVPKYVVGDELRVKQILNNILSNAFKYTEKGTVKLEVWNENDVDIMFRISDTGQGMTEEQLAMLGDQYSRFNPETNRAAEGTGLGMNITYSLVEMMGGEIAVESEVGVGTVVSVCLPQGKVNADVLDKEMIDNLHRFHFPNRAQTKGMHIIREPMPYGSVLIVDDVETNLYVAEGLLMPYQLRMETAMSGIEALRKIKEGKEYDIIFMDHMMPYMDGIETAIKMREMGYKRPIVALTANAMSGQAEIFLGNGFNDFISKPIDIRQLNIVLNKWVRDMHPADVVEDARRKANFHADVTFRASPMRENTPSGSKNGLSLQSSKLSSLGIDIEKGIKKFNGNEKTYLKILRSYASSTKDMLISIENISKENLTAYKLLVHSLKGMSYDIFADKLGDMADSLEAAARDGDINYIHANNPALLEAGWELVDSIEQLIL